VDYSLFIMVAVLVMLERLENKPGMAIPVYLLLGPFNGPAWA
jgi:hypothetical protein